MQQQQLSTSGMRQQQVTMPNSITSMMNANAPPKQGQNILHLWQLTVLLGQNVHCIVEHFIYQLLLFH
jgi:hypothetical protein